MQTIAKLKSSITKITITLLLGLSVMSYANTTFIDSNFWANNPTTGQIVTMLFGTGTSTDTAYTNHWQNNNCTPANITVQYIGTNNFPSSLQADRVYVVTGPQNITTPITINQDCIAIVASGVITIQLANSFNTTNAARGLIIDGFRITGNTTTHFLDNNNYSNITIHNNSINGFSGGNSTDAVITISGSNNIALIKNIITNSNKRAIGLYTGQSIHIIENTIQNHHTAIRAENTTQTRIIGNIVNDNIMDAIRYEMSNIQAIIRENTIFNNSFGISLSGLAGQQSTYIQIEKNKIFNNQIHGILGLYTEYSSITDSIIHNNQIHGIMLVNTQNIILDTTQVYNNDTAIHIQAANTTILHNLKLSSSSTNGLSLYVDGTNNVYYGSIELYGQTANIIAGSLQAGSTNDPGISTLGWTNGVLTQMINTPALINTTNRLSCTIGIFNRDILNFFTNLCQDWGYIGSITIGTNSPYYIGERVLKQRNTAQYSGTNLVLNNTIINPQLYITDNSFGGRIQTTGGANYITGLIHYTNTNQLRIYASQQAQYSIGGHDISTNNNNFNPAIITGTIQSGQIITIALPWTASNGYKIITGALSTGSETSNIYSLFRRYDTTGPDQITLINPAQNAQVLGNQVTLERSAGVDTGAGISGYNYRVASDSTFNNILFSGTTTNTGVIRNNIPILANYYRQVQGFDKLGNSGTVTSGTFQYGLSGFIITVNNTNFPTNSGQTFTVTAYDINNNIITGYTNTVTFALTGINTIAQTPPANYSFTLANNGTQTFTNALNINYPGIYTFNVMDTLNNARSGSTTVIVAGQAPTLFSGSIQTNPNIATSGIVNLTINSSATGTYGIRINNIHRQGLTPINTSTTIQLNLINTLPQNGTYTITVILNHNNGIYTYTMTQNIIYDTIAPVITIQSPITGTYQMLNQPMIARTVVETGAGINNYTIVMSGQSQVYTATNQINNNYRAGTPLPDGLYTMTIYGYDNAGNMGTASSTFTIDNTPPVILSGYPHQIVINNPFTFSWTVIDSGGIANNQFMLRDFYNNPIIPNPIITFTGNISPIQLGLGSLNPGIYKRRVIVQDNVGLTTQSPEFIFGIHNALPGQIQGFMEFQSVFGNVIQYNGDIYSNTTQIQAALFANMPSNVSINGNINPNIGGVPLLAPYPYTLQAINLIPGDGVKNISALFSTGTINPFSVAKQITLDTTAPTQAQLIQPLNGESIINNTIFSRTGSIDTGVGMSGYMIEISTGSTFATIAYTGHIVYPTHTRTIQSGTINNGTYYRRIKAFDKLGNQSNSDIRSFVMLGTNNNLVNPTNATPNTFTLNTINNATPNIAYKSNAVTVAGLTTGQQALATVSTGILFINGSGVGTTGLVMNGNIVEVELIASNQYNIQVSSTLSIGTRSAVFNVRTISQDDLSTYNGLTNTQRFQIRIIFDALVNTYGANDSRTLGFFMTLRTAIESMLGLNTLHIAQKDALEFFLSLVNNYINTLGGPNPFDGARYTARNGRIFSITFDATRVAYTSPDFIKPAYFASWNAMKNHIDIHNPGSLQGILIGNIQTLSNNRGSDVEVMPNGKIYRVEQKINGMRYSQDTLSGREFSTRAGLVSWLRSNNQTIRHF